MAISIEASTHKRNKNNTVEVASRDAFIGEGEGSWTVDFR